MKKLISLLLVIIIGKKKLFYSSARLPHFTYQGVGATNSLLGCRVQIRVRYLCQGIR